MGWFSKGEEVPQVVSAPVLPELSKKEEPKKKDLPELPTFPSNSKNENFNQEMVKSAVGDVPSSGENKVSMDFPKDFHTTEKSGEESLIPPKFSESIPELPKHTLAPSKTGAYKTAHDPSWYSGEHESIQDVPTKTLQEIPKVPKEVPKKAFELNTVQDSQQVLKRVEPIFVRIDKFQLAQKNFGQIKEKVKDIESVLEKISDIKLKEESELKGWTEDIEKIKSQLSEIDSGVFDQI